MIKLYDKGAFLVNGTELVQDTEGCCQGITKEEAAKQTIAYGILKEHNTSSDMNRLKIKFDKLTSHDITFVGIAEKKLVDGSLVDAAFCCQCERNAERITCVFV